MKDANSSEFDAGCRVPVIDLMDEQQGVTNKGGTMRLGAYPCRLKSGSLAHQAYDTGDIEERHRHRWELNNKYLEVLEANGLVPSGRFVDRDLVEIVELPSHPCSSACSSIPSSSRSRCARIRCSATSWARR